MLKHLIPVALVLATLVSDHFLGIAHAGGRDWTTMNTTLQLTWSAMHLIDWSQTRTIAKNPDIYYEKVNPVLGKHPSVGKVDTWMASTLVANAAFAYLLPHPYREVFQGLSIGMTGYCITINFKIDLRGGDWF